MCVLAASQSSWLMPCVPQAAAGCTPRMGLGWSFLTSLCWMTWSPQINLVVALQIALILGELTPNRCQFCGCACSLQVSGTPAAGMCRKGERGKSLGLQISNPKPNSLGFLPRKSVLPLVAEPCQSPPATLPTAARWCRVGFCLLFFPNPYCQEPRLLNCCGGGGKAEAQDHAHAAHPSW